MRPLETHHDNNHTDLTVLDRSETDMRMRWHQLICFPFMVLHTLIDRSSAKPRVAHRQEVDSDPQMP